jgi:hypothetical protein
MDSERVPLPVVDRSRQSEYLLAGRWAGRPDRDFPTVEKRKRPWIGVGLASDPVVDSHRRSVPVDQPLTWPSPRPPRRLSVVLWRARNASVLERGVVRTDQLPTGVDDLPVERGSVVLDGDLDRPLTDEIAGVGFFDEMKERERRPIEALDE